VLVTVSAFREPYEAHLFRGRLEAEGIFALVLHEYWIGNEWPMSVAFGGVKVQVLQGQYEAAREIERACCRGEYRGFLREELGDLDDAVCPHCGGTEYRQRRPIIRAALAIMVSLTLGSVVPPTGWILRCKGCLREYRAPPPAYAARNIAMMGAGAVLLLVGVVTVWLWNSLDFLCDLGLPCL
jgi:hypothetical protein